VFGADPNEERKENTKETKKKTKAGVGVFGAVAAVFCCGSSCFVSLNLRECNGKL